MNDAAVQGGDLSQTEVQDLEYRLARALSDKLRIEILEQLGMQPYAAVELVPILGATLSRIDYHMKILEKLDLIEEVKRVPVRGATKIVYKSNRRDVPKRCNVGEAFGDDESNIQRGRHPLHRRYRAERAIHARTFDSRPDRHMAGVTLPLDEEAFVEAAGLALGNLEAFKRLAHRSAERAKAKGRDVRFRVTLAQLLFETPPPRNSDTLKPRQKAKG